MDSDPYLAAQEMVDNGLSVFPVNAKSKRPLLDWLPYQERRATEEEVAGWGTVYGSGVGLAVATGAVSNVVVVDLDLYKTPEAERAALIERARKRWGSTPWVSETQSGGQHWWYQHPGTETRNRAGLMTHVDLRGDGGYVLAPPSPGYTWLAHDGDQDELPVYHDAEPSAADTRDPWDLLMAEPLKVVQVEEGQRNDMAAKVAGKLISQGVRDDVVLDTLRAWNHGNNPPLDDAELVQVVTSIRMTHTRHHPAEDQLIVPHDPNPTPAGKCEGDEDPRSKLARLLAAQLSNGVCDVARFLDHEPPPQDWIFEDLIPRGTVGLMVGAGGTGKGFFGLHLAIEAAIGGAFAQFSVPRPMRVLVITLEDTEDILHRRIRSAIDAAHPFGFSDEDEAALRANLHILPVIGTGHDLGTIASAILRSPPHDLIFVDPLGKALPDGVELNSAEGAKALHQVMWHVVGEQKNVTPTFVAFHHVPKANQREGTQLDQTAASGHHLLVDFARFAIHLRKLTRKDMAARRLDPDGRFIEVVTGKQNNAPELSESIIMERGEGGGLRAVDAPSVAELDGLKVIALFDHLTAPVTTSDIIDAAMDPSQGEDRLSRDRTRAAIASLVDRGFLAQTVDHTKRGKPKIFTLTPLATADDVSDMF
jgi:hypothetical protein